MKGLLIKTDNTGKWETVGIGGMWCKYCEEWHHVDDITNQKTGKYGKSNMCGACKRDSNTKNRHKNVGAYKATQKKYKDANKDKVKKWSATWRAKNPEKMAESRKNWKDNNPDKIKSMANALYAKNAPAVQEANRIKKLKAQILTAQANERKLEKNVDDFLLNIFE